MAKNSERFGVPASMHKRAIEEGLADLQEEDRDEAAKKAQEALEMSKKADEIIDAFYEEGLIRGAESFEFALPEKLAGYPDGTKNAIFKRWFERDPGEALWRIKAFGSLPARFQKDIADYVAKKEIHDVVVFTNILGAFDKVTNRHLTQLFLDNLSIEFSFLAENKEKFPYASDEQILAATEKFGGRRGATYIDWAAIIPYLDKFPSVDKRQAIEETLKQEVNATPAVLIKYREKLGLSEREMIDLFYEHNKAYALCAALDAIDPAFHQEIADKVIEEGKSWHVFRNAKQLQQVDVPELLTKMTYSKPLSRFVVIEGMNSNVHLLPSSWFAQMPKGLVDAMIQVNVTVR